MRTVRFHAEPQPQLRDMFPGVIGQRIWLELEIARAIREATAAGVDWRHRFLHLEPDGVTVRDRDEYAAQLRRSGVRQLASQLASAVIPPDRLLCLVDLEGASWVSITSVAGLLGEEAA